MKLRRVKKWIRMLAGKGTLHVRKGEGKYWSRTEVKGFYIDYSGKLNTSQINDEGIPYTKLENGTNVLLPITVIQYGLGCYECILDGQDKRDEFYKCVRHMVKTQAEDGSWKAFEAQQSHDMMSSMVQGEATALLLRAYIDSGDNEYLEAAESACNFMLLSKNDGGTSDVVEGHLVLLEGTWLPMILNGAIYSWFGLYDLWKITNDVSYKMQMEDVVMGIKNLLPRYDNGFWSLYCMDGRIASPFYHQLHITQLRVLSKIMDDSFFDQYADVFERYYNNKFCYIRAFIKKAFQKLTEKSDSIAIVE